MSSEEARERSRKWYQENRQRALERQAQYRQSPDVQLAQRLYHKLWADRKADKVREAKRLWYEANRERLGHKPMQRAAERVRRYDAPISEVWPYGADEPLVNAVNALLPLSIPEWVRADAGQQAVLECLAGQVGESQLDKTVKRCVRKAWGEYAVSIDWRRADGFALADQIAAPEVLL